MAFATLAAQSAEAHIDVDRAGSHVSRHGTDQIKAAPCGAATTARGDNVYTYKPGSTIEVVVSEFVHHPGYFRIAFDDDGHDGFLTPVSITGEHGDCAGDPKCGAGMADFCNNETVLIDNLDPHPGEGFFAPPKEWTWKVKLPDVECDNCTLQIMQVMTDLNVHLAPYPDDDIYYQCIDLVLSSEAEDDGVEPGPIGGVGMDCKAGAPMAGSGGSGGAGGMAGTGGAGGMAGTGGAAGATGGAGGAAGTGGVTAGTGGMAGGAGTGGSAGAAAVGGSLGTGGAAGAAGAAGTAGMVAAGTGAPSSETEDSGCAAGGALHTKGVLGALFPLALALLLVRRRRA